jgi:hypothetical protein
MRGLRHNSRHNQGKKAHFDPHDPLLAPAMPTGYYRQHSILQQKGTLKDALRRCLLGAPQVPARCPQTRFWPLGDGFL